MFCKSHAGQMSAAAPQAVAVEVLRALGEAVVLLAAAIEGMYVARHTPTVMSDIMIVYCYLNE